MSHMDAIIVKYHHKFSEDTLVITSLPTLCDDIILVSAVSVYDFYSRRTLFVQCLHVVLKPFYVRVFVLLCVCVSYYVNIVTFCTFGIIIVVRNLSPQRLINMKEERIDVRDFNDGIYVRNTLFVETQTKILSLVT